MKIKTIVIVSENELAVMVLPKLAEKNPALVGKVVEKAFIVAHPEKGLAIHLVEEK